MEEGDGLIQDIPEELLRALEDEMGKGVKPSKKLPRIASTPEKREALVKIFDQIVSDGVSSRDGLEAIWEQNERIYRNEIAGPRSVLDGLEPFHVPLSQPRQDQLVAITSNIICTQKPYMLCDCGDTEGARAREMVVHREWERANFDLVIQELGQIATNTNRGILRVTYAHDPSGILTGDATTTSPKRSQVKFSGINLEVIHPYNFICLPATVNGIRGAYAVGHRFYRTVADIRELQRLGKYIKPTDGSEPLSGGDTPLTTMAGDQFRYAGISDDPAYDPSMEKVELWDIIVKLSGGPDLDSPSNQRYYRATYANTDRCLLAFEEYPFSRPWYFGFGFLLDQNQFWSGRSIARNLAPLQDAYNSIHTALYNGAMMSSMPPVFGPKPSGEKSSYYGYGEYVEVTGGDSIQVPTIQFRGEPLERQAASIERIADLVSRVSENMMGATNRTEITATQTEVVSSGANAGLQAYIRCFTDSLPEAASFTMELLHSYYPMWQHENPESAAALPYGEFEDYGLWTTAGKSPMSTRTARLQSLQMLLQTGLQLQSAGIDVGIQWYEFVRTILENADLVGNDKIQMSPEEMAKQQQLQMEQQAMMMEAQGGEAQPGSGPDQGVPVESNMGDIPPGMEGPGGPGGDMSQGF